MTRNTPSRLEGLDTCRGLLLVGMVGVHVVSAYGTVAHVNSLHGGVGIFLISAGFVAFSGFVAAMKQEPPVRADALRGAETAAHLLLVMVGYNLAFSFVRHVLARMAGGDAACTAADGWIPPVRLDDLGILLPIALVSLQSPLARFPSPAARLGVAVLALAWMLLPALPAPAEGPLRIAYDALAGVP